MLRASLAGYWAEHAHADLDVYVDAVLEAKKAGLPVRLGLEVDHYAGRMDKVAGKVGPGVYLHEHLAQVHAR